MSNTTTAVAKQEPNQGERFLSAVVKEFCTNGTGAMVLDDRRRNLVQSYFIIINNALTTADANRLKKNAGNSDHKWDNNVPITWENVNLNSLAKDISVKMRMGLDMTLPNHLFPIPYYNKETKKYDVNLMIGYNGHIHIAEKYALRKPKNVTVELVYSTDHFLPVKKSKDNPIETYEFEISEPFNRGKIIGGFGYLEFDDPTKNKLVLMDEEAILKRKPKHASAEFWGGTRKDTKWENGKKVTVDVEVPGWIEEMYLKTVKREVYSSKYIPIDPSKIDEDYQTTVAQEIRYAQLEAEAAIEENANTVPIAEVVPPVQLPPPTNPENAEPF
jgi:recombination protein RecT